MRRNAGWLALCLSALSLGCGSTTAPGDVHDETRGGGDTQGDDETQGGDETQGDDEPPADIPWPATLPEIELNCPDVDFPALGPSAALSGDVTLLPCDEMWSSWQGGLLYPDGELVLFDNAGFAPKTPSPSGDLLSPEAADPNRMLLVDVHARTSREIGEWDWDGWVPSFDDRPWGAWKWTCTDGVLEIHDPEQSTILDEGVTCIRVVESLGAPILVYDTGDTLHIANVDEQTVVEADVPPFQYEWGTPCQAGFVAGYDGRFASLQQVCDDPEQDFLMIFSTVDGSRVVHEPGPWEALSIPGREQGWVIYDGETLRGLGPEGLNDLATDIRFVTGTSLLYAQRKTEDPDSCELLRGNAESLESLGLGPCIDSLLARPDHAGIVTFRDVSPKIQLMETWTQDAGWAWPQPIASVDAEWADAILHSDGTAMAFERHPEGRVIIVSPAGEVLAQWTGRGVDGGDQHFVIRTEGVTEGLYWEAAAIVDHGGQVLLEPVGELEASHVGVASIPYSSRVVAIGRKYDDDGLAWYGTYP